MAETKQINPVSNKRNFLKLILIIGIPLAVIAIIFIVISLLDLNPMAKVKDFAHEIPVINQFVSPKEEADLEQQEQQSQSQISHLEEEITILESDLMIKTREVDELNQEITKLNHQIEHLHNEVAGDEPLEDNQQKLLDTYQEMSPKSVALIIMELSQPDALIILQAVDEAHRGNILSALDPKTAAIYTEQLLR